MVSGYISFRSFCLSSLVSIPEFPSSDCPRPSRPLFLLLGAKPPGTGGRGGAGPRSSLGNVMGWDRGRCGRGGNYGKWAHGGCAPRPRDVVFPARAPCATSRCRPAASHCGGGEYILTPAVCAPGPLAPLSRPRAPSRCSFRVGRPRVQAPPRLAPHWACCGR